MELKRELAKKVAIYLKKMKRNLKTNFDEGRNCQRYFLLNGLNLQFM